MKIGKALSYKDYPIDSLMIRFGVANIDIGINDTIYDVIINLCEINTMTIILKLIHENRQKN